MLRIVWKSFLQLINLNLLVKGKFTSKAGLVLLYKVECDALSRKDIKTLAHIIEQKFPYRFSRVVSVPRGGDRLTREISHLGTGDSQDPVLVVEDVVTTGGSILEKIEQVTRETGEKCIGFVIIARGELPENVHAFMHVSEWAW